MAAQIASFVTNVGMPMLFSLGYYWFKNKKPSKSPLSKSEEMDTLLIQKVNCLKDINLLIQQKKLISDSDIILDIIVKHGINPNVETYNLLLSHSYSNNNVIAARKLKDELMFNLSNNCGVKPDITSLSILIKGIGIEFCLDSSECKSIKDEEKKLLDAFDQQLKSIISIFKSHEINLDLAGHNSLISALIDTERLEKAWGHFTFLKNAGNKNANLKPNAVTYITILKGIRQLNDGDYNIKKIFVSKAKCFISDNECAYLIKDNFYSQIIIGVLDLITKEATYSINAEQDLKEAEEILYKQEIHITHKKDLQTVYTTLINGYSKLNNINGAVRLFENFKKIIENTSAESDNLNHDGSFLGTDSDGEEDIIKDSVYTKDRKTDTKHELDGFVHIYSSIINACSKSKNMDLAEAFLAEMIKKGITINEYIFAIMINGYKKINHFGSAYKQYKQAKDNIDIQKSLVLYNSMLDCCVLCSQVSKMQEVFSELNLNHSDDDSKLNPDLITYSIILKGYARAGDMSSVMDLYYSIKLKLKLDERFYNSILDSFAMTENYEAFDIILKDMTANNVQKSAITYGIIIKLFSKDKYPDRALDAFKQMLKEGITPTVIIYQLLIKHNAKFNRLDECFSLYLSLVNSKVKPDAILTNYTITILCGELMIEKAAVILDKAMQIYIKELSNQIEIHKKYTECETEFDYESEDLVSSRKYTQKFKSFNFDNNSHTGILDLSTVEFFIWGVMEEKSMIYLDKKIALEECTLNIKALYEVINPYVLGSAYKLTGKDYNFDSKSIATIITNNCNNTSNISFKVINQILKLKSDLDYFHNHSSYSTSNKFIENKHQHTNKNKDYPSKLDNANKCYNKYHNKPTQPKQEEVCIDFADNQSQVTISTKQMPFTKNYPAQEQTYQQYNGKQPYRATNNYNQGYQNYKSNARPENYTKNKVTYTAKTKSIYD